MIQPSTSPLLAYMCGGGQIGEDSINPVFKGFQLLSKHRLLPFGIASVAFGIAQGGTYEGDWQNRAPHGQGRMVYSDGSVYIGGWKDFKFHGHGKLVQEGGVVFEGEFREGCMHGSGSAETRKLDGIVD